MIDFKPAPFKIAQRGFPALGEALPPPTIDPVYTGFTGIPGVVEAMAVLAITAAAAWVGISTGLSKNQDQSLRTAGWIGGVGSGLLGLLYLGGKTGYGQYVKLPSLSIVPA